MSAGQGSQQWERTDLHPKLPGSDLCYFDVTGGDEICLYDDENPSAYIIGDSVEVGSKQ